MNFWINVAVSTAGIVLGAIDLLRDVKLHRSADFLFLAFFVAYLGYTLISDWKYLRRGK